MLAPYLVNILCMSSRAEEQHSQTVLDTPEVGERGWEYREQSLDQQNCLISNAYSLFLFIRAFSENYMK